MDKTMNAQLKDAAEEFAHGCNMASVEALTYAFKRGAEYMLAALSLAGPDEVRTVSHLITELRRAADKKGMLLIAPPKLHPEAELLNLAAETIESLTDSGPWLAWMDGKLVAIVSKDPPSEVILETHDRATFDLLTAIAAVKTVKRDNISFEVVGQALLSYLWGDGTLEDVLEKVKEYGGTTELAIAVLKEPTP